jgi:multimeric flavodoxin WrbA
MSKNVLIISASPRKGGNSDTLCEQFRKGAEESGNRVEKIRLAELKIDYCSACYACKKIGHCVKQDDMELVIAKIREADVIVLATPVYFYTMCAQLKTMIDRTLGGAQKSGLENKAFYLIATAADGKAGMERTIDGLRGYLECLPGAKEMGVIYGAGAWQLGDIQRNSAMQEAYRMGKSICCLQGE